MLILNKISQVIFVILLIGSLILLFLLYGSLPKYSSALTLSGPQNSIEILRDQQAVPHIYTENELDAYFALGFVHAQDRLWQMEFNLRAATGKLAEWFGGSMLPHDRFQRSLGLTEIAKKDFSNLDPKTRAILSAYAQGINAYQKEISILPPEYLFLTTHPHIWEAHDSLVLLKQMAWQLSRNYWDELLYIALSKQLSIQELNDFFPSLHQNIPLPLLPDNGSDAYSLTQSAASILKKIPSRPPASVGSNNWVIGGSLTANNKPLLANDPHLKLSIPGIWYLAHISTPEMNLMGASLPGIPAILLGKNDFIAWAFTNTGADSQDLYMERSSKDDPQSYETPHGKAPFDISMEIIKVRNAPDEEIAIRRTRHGPIISDHDEEIQSLMPHSALALNWVGFHSHDSSLRFFHKAAHARSAQEFLQASRDYHAPLQNIIYADTDNNIGLITAGRTPIRLPENDLHGRVPALGWSQLYEWQGFVPFEHLPQQYNPHSAYIVTANHKITSPDYPYLIASDWAPPYRFNRINELIGNQNSHDISTSQSIQLDTKSFVAEQLLPIMLRTQANNEIERTLLAQLQLWDFTMRSDASQPLIFVEWTRQLMYLLLKNKLAGLSEFIDADNQEFLIHVLTNQDAQERWCVYTHSSSANRCQEEIASALRLAIEALNERYGTDHTDWTWKRAHISTAHHPLFGRLPFFSKLFDIDTARDGGSDTVNISGHRFDDQALIYKEEVAPTFRAIYDLANQNSVIFSLNSGQSGHFLSPYYKNLSTDWINGRYFTVYTDRNAISQNAMARLTISPSMK